MGKTTLLLIIKQCTQCKEGDQLLVIPTTLCIECFKPTIKSGIVLDYQSVFFDEDRLKQDIFLQKQHVAIATARLNALLEFQRVYRDE